MVTWLHVIGARQSLHDVQMTAWKTLWSLRSVQKSSKPYTLRRRPLLNGVVLLAKSELARVRADARGQENVCNCHVDRIYLNHGQRQR
jgi:hypothetical protein